MLGSQRVLSVFAVALFAVAPVWRLAPAGGSDSPHLPPRPGVASAAVLQWPVVGPVIRPFEAPTSPYGPGHRGIDISAPFGTPVLAAADGVVAFAGWAGSGYSVSIDHDGGIRTTYSWLSEVDVHKGDAVRAGDRVALSGDGHPGVTPSHLHFGVKIGDQYLDPLVYLSGADVTEIVRLAPLD